MSMCLSLLFVSQRIIFSVYNAPKPIRTSRSFLVHCVVAMRVRLYVCGVMLLSLATSLHCYCYCILRASISYPTNTPYTLPSALTPKHAYTHTHRERRARQTLLAIEDVCFACCITSYRCATMVRS